MSVVRSLTILEQKGHVYKEKKGYHNIDEQRSNSIYRNMIGRKGKETSTSDSEMP